MVMLKSNAMNGDILWLMMLNGIEQHHHIYMEKDEEIFGYLLIRLIYYCIIIIRRHQNLYLCNVYISALGLWE